MLYQPTHPDHQQHAVPSSPLSSRLPWQPTDSAQHLFPLLPAELRWKIWDLNLPGPRIVSIRCGSDSTSLATGSGLDADGPGRSSQEGLGPSFSASASSLSPSDCTSPASIPTNLHVCHESRREALRRYRPSFGTARRPGRVFFDRDRDVLYFGPRDGFMASEAQLRTVLTLCDPAELSGVRRVAVNDALFWAYGSSGGPGGLGAGAMVMTHATIASSLLVDVLQLVRARLPGLEELVFVPRDENPLYSGASCLVEPAIIQSRLARQVRDAVGLVFGDPSSGLVNGVPSWSWKVMTLSADPDPPIYGRGVLGWEEVVVGHGRDDYNAGGAGNIRGSLGEEDMRTNKHWASREVTRLGALQESLRRQFMQMEMGVCG